MKPLTEEDVLKNRESFVLEQKRNAKRVMWGIIGFCIGTLGLIIFVKYYH